MEQCGIRNLLYFFRLFLNRRKRLASGGLDLLLDLCHDGIGFFNSALGFQPSRRLRELVCHKDRRDDRKDRRNHELNSPVHAHAHAGSDQNEGNQVADRMRPVSNKGCTTGPYATVPSRYILCESCKEDHEQSAQSKSLCQTEDVQNLYIRRQRRANHDGDMDTFIQDNGLLTANLITDRTTNQCSKELTDSVCGSPHSKECRSRLQPMDFI